MEPLFEYYDMHLTGYVVRNADEPEQEEPDEQELELL
jgi:hypothetical protein